METKSALPENATQNGLNLDTVFDDLITKGQIERDVKLGPTLILTLRTLSSEDYLDAESVYVASIPTVPADVVARVRMVSHITNATVKINGMPVEQGTEKERREAREKLRKQLMKLPPMLIDKIHAVYSEMINEQNKLYEELTKNVENF